MTNTNELRLLLTVEEAGKALSIGRTKLYQEITSGRLRTVRIGRARRVPVAALEQWVNDRLSEAS